MPTLMVLVVGNLPSQGNDLLSLAKNIQNSGASSTLVRESPPTDTETPMPRGYAQVTKLGKGDCLYIVAHGDGTSWGTSGDDVSVKQEDMVAFLARADVLKAGVKVFMCVCDSIEGGKVLKQHRSDLTVWAAEGTPCLAWKPGVGITDSTGRFKECKAPSGSDDKKSKE